MFCGNENADFGNGLTRRGRDYSRSTKKILLKRKAGCFGIPCADFEETSKEGARTGVHGRGAQSSQRTHNAVLRSGVLHEGRLEVATQ